MGDRGWSLFVVATIDLPMSVVVRRDAGKPWPSDDDVGVLASERLSMLVTVTRAMTDGDEAVYERTYGRCEECGRETSATLVRRCSKHWVDNHSEDVA